MSETVMPNVFLNEYLRLSISTYQKGVLRNRPVPPSLFLSLEGVDFLCFASSDVVK